MGGCLWSAYPGTSWNYLTESLFPIYFCQLLGTIFSEHTIKAANGILLYIFVCMTGNWSSTFPSFVCQWLQYTVGSHICYFIDSWLCIDNIPWGENLWSKTWKWHLTFNIHKHHFLLASICWSDCCAGISGW